ncbi:MAG: ABC transporter permease [Planctomycetes bacterium]|nr:ABC transporter permease [Planctomycetota bacterium]
MNTLADVPQPCFWLPLWTLAWREVVRFFRQKNRVVGALGTPLVFWLLFGLGLRNSFQPPETSLPATGAGVVSVASVPGGQAQEATRSPARMDYLEYFYPGTLVLILLFASIFSTISIIEDRKEGFLQGVLVSPVPLFALVLGKLIGGTVVGVVQALLFLFLAPALGIAVSAASLGVTAALLCLVGFGLTGLGFLIAWKMDSVAGFHAIMNLLLMPMWLLSGAFFPAAGAHAWIRGLMTINPLTYGLAAIRHALYAADLARVPDLPSLGTSALVSAAFALAMVLATALIAHGRETGR